MIMRIAVRNIIRHKRRTILSAVTIAVGIFFFVAMDSLYTGYDRGAIDNLITLSCGAVKIQTKEYAENRSAFPLDDGIRLPDSTLAAIISDRRVRGVTPRTLSLAQLSTLEDMVPVVAVVIDPGQDSTVFSLVKHLDGSYFSSNSTREIIIGHSLAEELKVGIGQSITLYATTRFDSRNADEFTVVGLLKTSDPAINKSMAFITYEAANEFLDLQGLVTELDIGVHRKTNFKSMENDISNLQSSIAARAPSVVATTFLQEGAVILAVSKQKRSFGSIFLLVILIIAAVGVFNTVLMSVYERIREIGILRAHGMTPSEITWLFVLEGMCTGLVGAAIGACIAIAANAALVFVGIPMDKLAGKMDTTGIPLWGTLHGEWAVTALIGAVVLSVVVSCIAASIPARYASKIAVTRALRFS
ncbi:MAG: ABC transporter permease [Chitinivibrionales bacterium]|nr:ABC transporter permease [Chitinivibrionales bacterium]